MDNDEDYGEMQEYEYLLPGKMTGLKSGQIRDDDEDYVYEDDEDRSDFDEDEEYEDGDGYDEDEDDDDVDEQYDGDEEDGDDAPNDAAENEAMANAIINSISSILPSATPAVEAPAEPSSLQPRKTIRMTDLGLRISQMVILKNKAVNEPVHPQEEGVHVDSGDNLLDKTLSNKRRNKTGVRGRPKQEDYGFGRSTTVKLSPEVAKLMGKANMAFVQKNYEEAIEALQEVIRQASSSHEPYHTLGLIYEEMGQLDKAFSYYLLSAHLSKGGSSSDSLELWNKLTMIAIRLGLRQETVYCLSKVLAKGRIAEPQAFWIRSRLYLELQSYHNVIWSFLDMLRRNFCRLEEWQNVGRLALRINMSYDAAKLFAKIFDELVDGSGHGRGQPVLASVADLSWSHLNLLLEMLMATKNWEGLLGALERYAPVIYYNSSRKRTLSLGDDAFMLPAFETVVPSIPVDIQTKLAMALLSEQFHSSTALPYGLDGLIGVLDPEGYGDLRLALGDAYQQAKQHDLALQCYIPLLHHPQYGDWELCLKIGKCHEDLRNYEDAIGVLSVAYQLEPERLEIRVALAEVYKAMDQIGLAAQILGDYADNEKNRKTTSVTADAKVNLDPGAIFNEVYGPTDLSLLYGIDPNSVGDGTLASSTFTSSLLLKLPSIASSRPHPALRRIRRRRRKLTQIRFTEDQIAAVQADYRRARIYYQQAFALEGQIDYLAVDNFLQVSTPLVEDDLTSNTFLCNLEEKYRTVGEEIRKDLGSLHGLYIDEWYNLLEMHIVLLGRIGSPDRAIRLLRSFHFQSAFSRDPQMAAGLRLLQLALTMRAGRIVGGLITAKWFLVTHPSTYAPALLYSLLTVGRESKDGHGEGAMFDPRNFRPMSRQAYIRPSNLPQVLMAAHIALARSNFEEAIKLYTDILAGLQTTDDASWIGKARVRQCLALAILESSFKRTCLNPKLGLAQGFALLAANHQEAPEEHRQEMTYNFARVCQMCGLASRAEPLYQALFGMPEGKFHMDAAFNLYLIYLQAGNNRLARSVLQKHCRI